MRARGDKMSARGVLGEEKCVLGAHFGRARANSAFSGRPHARSGQLRARSERLRDFGAPKCAHLDSDFLQLSEVGFDVSENSFSPNHPQIEQRSKYTLAMPKAYLHHIENQTYTIKYQSSILLLTVSKGANLHTFKHPSSPPCQSGVVRLLKKVPLLLPTHRPPLHPSNSPEGSLSSTVLTRALLL